VDDLDAALAATGPEPESVIVVVPGRPPNPNRTRRYHWRARHRADQEWRQAGRLSAHGLRRTPMQRATLDVVHVVPDRRRRDLDNLTASIKAVLDGIVDAGVIADDSSRVLVSVTHRIEHEPGVAATRFTFTEAEDAA
jgi:crossover junction endodeoxyribonuclease RusA